MWLYKLLNWLNKTPELEIGQTWKLRDDDPFSPVIAKIVDVKDGWVQYRFWYNRLRRWGADLNSSEAECFRAIYRLVEDGRWGQTGG